MENDFILLRNEIYTLRKISSPKVLRQSHEKLLSSLIKPDPEYKDVIELILQAKILRDTGGTDTESAGELKQHIGKNPYLDRFILDLLPPPHQQVFYESEKTTDAFKDFQIKTEDFFSLNPEGIILYQFMFYGDPARTGKGISGGLGTFLSNLAEALGRKIGIGLVCTVALYNCGKSSYGYAPVEKLGEKNYLLRLPVCLPSLDRMGFLTCQDALENSISKIIPEKWKNRAIFHVRYLDNASLAAARTAQRLNIPAVTTLTPDPHRKICDTRGKIQQFPFSESMDIINRIYIGDELLSLSRGIVGIGKGIVERELKDYFPGLTDKPRKIIREIDEGIQIIKSRPDRHAADIFFQTSTPFSLNLNRTDKSVLLNVGRLDRFKGQDKLLQVWNDFKLYEKYNLVFIGGDFKNPTSGEERIINYFLQFSKDNPHLQGSFACTGALKNQQTRSIEACLGELDRYPFPNIYFSSSYKEEFGISILEAMAAGLITTAPKYGGTARYINHGENGFLTDTRSIHAMGDCITKEILTLSHSAIRGIAHNARKTISAHFSIDKIAEDFHRFYKGVFSSVHPNS